MRDVGGMVYVAEVPDRGRGRRGEGLLSHLAPSHVTLSNAEGSPVVGSGVGVRTAGGSSLRSE